MLTSQYAKSCPRLRINAVDPGYTSTDLNGHRGTQSVEKGGRSSCGWPRCGPTARPGPSPTCTELPRGDPAGSVAAPGTDQRVTTTERANGIEMCDLASGEALAVRPLPGSGAISAGRAVPRSEDSRL
jgi:hypothetical protein